jgi:hypothetical protein
MRSLFAAGLIAMLATALTSTLGVAQIAQPSTPPLMLPPKALSAAKPPASNVIPYANNPIPDIPQILGNTTIPKVEKPTLHLTARVTEEGQTIRSGLVWRVFQEANDRDDTKMKLIATAAGGEAMFKLDPGSYLIHAAYGRAGATTRVNVEKDQRDETLVLNAGGVRLTALGADDVPLDLNNVTFDIFSKDSDQRGDRQALVLGAKPGKIIRLNADTYHVVSRYGEINAVVRAEIHVNPGKLTEATIYHKAAKTTLKLVASPGGEALANVNWIILSPSGDQIGEAVGAFPSVALAVGDYSVVAKHLGQIYTRNFSVVAGQDRDLELLAEKLPAKP